MLEKCKITQIKRTSNRSDAIEIDILVMTVNLGGIVHLRWKILPTLSKINIRCDTDDGDDQV